MATKDFSSTVFKWFAICVVAATIVGGIVFAWPKYTRSRALREQESELEMRILEKRQAIKELITNQQRFKTDADFVEMIARQNRRVFPGELIFLFEKD